MKFKRRKPNHEPWKNPPAPQTEPTHPLDDARQRVEALLAPLAGDLIAVSASLDEMCAVNGHRWTEYIYSDRIVCATCGRDREEVYQKTKSMNEESNMWKKVSEELPPPNELVLLQLTGDEYITGWHSPHLEVWFGNGKSPWRIEEGFVEKWCNIVRPYDAPDAG